MAQMHNPPHPGEVLRDVVFSDAEVSVTEFAARLGVTRVALSRVLNGNAGISADMALRLAAALGGSAQSWLHMQSDDDLWHAERALRRQVARITPLKCAAALPGSPESIANLTHGKLAARSIWGQPRRP